MTAFRSRMNGHRHVSLGQWLGCVAFAALTPAATLFVGAYLVAGVFYALGKLAPEGGLFGSDVYQSGLVILAVIGYTSVVIAIAALGALLFLRVGWAGWATATFVGGVAAGLLGLFFSGHFIWVILGIIHGYLLWLGLALFAPSALKEQTP